MENINNITVSENDIRIDLSDNYNGAEILLVDSEDKTVLEKIIKNGINLDFQMIVEAIRDRSEKELSIYFKLKNNKCITELINTGTLGVGKENQYIFQGIVKEILNERYVFELYYDTNGLLTMDIKIKEININASVSSIIWSNLNICMSGEISGEVDKISDLNLNIVRRENGNVLLQEKLTLDGNRFILEHDFNEIDLEEGVYDFNIVVNNEYSFKITYSNIEELQYNLKETNEKIFIVKPYKSVGAALALFVKQELKVNVTVNTVQWIGDKLRLKGNVNNSFNVDLENADTMIVLKLRESDVEVIEQKIIIEDGQLDVMIDMKEFLHREYSKGIWDFYVNVQYKNLETKGYIECYDESIVKHIILPVTTCITDNKELFYLRPYYNASNRLSILVKSSVEFKKVNSIEVKNDIVRFDLDIFKREDSFKLINNDINKDMELIILNDFLEIELLLGKIESLSENSIIFNVKINSKDIRHKLLNNTIFLKLYIGENWFKIKLNIENDKIVQGIIEKLQTQSIYKKIVKKSYSIFNKILPVKKNLIVFESFGGKDVQCNPKYLCMEMQKYKQFKKVFILKDIEQTPMDGVKYIRTNTLKYFYYLARAKYLVNNGNYPNFVKKRKGTIHISTWHGTPLKKIGFDVEKNSPSYVENTSDAIRRRIKRWDYLISQNPYSSEIFRSCFNFKGKMLEVGYPRNEVFFYNNEKQEEIKDQIKKRYNIPNGKKVILYVPTWRDYFKKENVFNINFSIEQMKKELGDNYVLLIKTHHLITNDLNLEKYKGFAYNVSFYNDVQELYLLTDILITDYSSVMFDFANSNRPILFFTYDLDRYFGEERTAYFDLEKESPGPLVFNTNEIIDAIKNIDDIKVEYSERYENFKEKFCSLDNNRVSEKVINTTLNVNGNCSEKDIYFLTFNIYGMGGTSRTITNTANYLAEHGWNVEIISVFGDKKAKYFKLDERIKVTRLQPKYKDAKNIHPLKKLLNLIPSVIIHKDDEVYKSYTLVTDLKIYRKLRSIKKGVIVSTRPGYNVMLAKFFKKRGLYLIGQEHIYMGAHTKGLQDKIKKYYHKLDLLMTLTESDKNSYLDEIKKLENKVVAIPNAVPSIEEVENNLDNKVIISAGRLSKEKGFDLLIEAASQVFDKHNDWKLKIFGIGKEKSKLQELIIEKNLTNNVFLMGSTKQIEKEMEKSSIYVLSSRHEGFGMVIIEAMECGVPVVSFDCPEGPRAIISNNVDGLLVENGNTHELANGILKLIESKELRVKLADNAKKSVKRFNMENIGKKWEELIK